MRYEQIPLNKLFVSNLNTRKDLQAGQEDSGITELAGSIREKGLLSPLVVRQVSLGRFEVLAGQRRLRACQQIGFDRIPCLVRDNVEDSEAVAISLIENVHRADMNPLDKARALKALYDRYGSYERAAKETAWSVTTVRKYIRLLDLPEELQLKIGTTEGPGGVSALAKLATTFSGTEAIEVYEKISAFKRSIQEEILKRSGGDISQIEGLVEQAQEGAFNARFCGGAFRCEIIRDVIQGKVNKSDFMQLVEEVAESLESDLSEASLRKAAREFWKTLARK
jgi:ParB family chromosome partitioning protein